MSKIVFTPLVALGLLLAGCVPITPEPPASTLDDNISTSENIVISTSENGVADCCCANGNLYIQPGKSVKDKAWNFDGVPSHVDMTAISSSLDGEILTVTFFLREIPEKITFRREGTEPLHVDYSWAIQIDVDGPPEGFHSVDYMLALTPLHIKTVEESQPLILPFASGEFEAQVMKVEHPVDTRSSPSLIAVPTTYETEVLISQNDSSITLSGKVPGMTSESFLSFFTFDSVHGADIIECF